MAMSDSQDTPILCAEHGEVVEFACAECGRLLCSRCPSQEEAGQPICRRCLAPAEELESEMVAQEKLRTGNMEPQSFWDLPRALLTLLFQPSAFFGTMQLERGWLKALLMGLFFGTIGGIGAVYFGLQGDAARAEMAELQSQFQLSEAGVRGLIASLVPLVRLMELALYTLGIELAFRFLSIKGKPLVTLKVVAYASAVKFLGLIPYIGETLSMVFFMGLLFIGVHRAHRLPLGRALIAVAIPILLFMGLGLFAIG